MFIKLSSLININNINRTYNLFELVIVYITSDSEKQYNLFSIKNTILSIVFLLFILQTWLCSLHFQNGCVDFDIKCVMLDSVCLWWDHECKKSIQFSYFDTPGSPLSRKMIKKIIILDIKCAIFDTLSWFKSHRRNDTPILRIW